MIKIPVSADLDTSGIDKKLASMREAMNRMGAEALKTGKIRFEPVTKTSIDEMKKANAEFERMLKISGGLRKNIAESGQSGKGWDQIDWVKIFPSDRQRQAYMHTLLNRLRPGTSSFLPDSHSGPGGGGPGGSGGSGGPARHAPLGGTKKIVNQVAGAGLRATGPAGSVAAGALDTGIVSGAGAGVAGLLGGMLALGVSKVVGAAIENLDKAQNNEVAYDRLKRSIGDVSVSFGGLREVVKAAATDTRTTFDEAASLSSLYARNANLAQGDYKQLGGAMNLGVGLSRSYGLDPAQGVGVLGEMRGVGVNRNEQDSRKFALLIGETIAKSRSFAKADEIIQSLAGYAVNQTRMSLGSNTEGYAGALTGLLGMHLPGLDVAGASNLLGRTNAAITGGGAYGEASQFFTARMGARMGLDPMRTRMLVEGGAFNTLDKTFGSGSMASRFGISGPGGNTTVLQSQLDQLRGDYANQSPTFLLEATKNHFGLQSMNQAGALLSMKPGDMGKLSKYAQGKNLNGESIGNLAMAMVGSESDRESIYKDLSTRTGADALTDSERAKLERSRSNGGDDFKDTLAQLAASRGQESTQGKDIRDSRALLDNIKTDIASKLIPAVEAMRDGVIYLAGGGKKSAREISQDVAKINHDEHVKSLKDSYSERITAQQNIIDNVMGPEGTGLQTATSDEQQAVTDAYAEKQRLERERDGKIGAANSSFGEEKKNIDAAANSADQVEERRKQVEEAARSRPGGIIPGITRADALTSAMIDQESGGRHRNRDGSLVRSGAGAAGITQLMPGTMRDPGFGVRPLQNNSEEEFRRVGSEYLGALKREFGGDEAKALAAYNAGHRRVKKAVSKFGDDWLSHMPRETQRYVPNILNRLPSDHPAAGQSNGQQALQVEVTGIMQHQNERGQEVLPPTPLTTRVEAPRPSGS
jgi:hypothetical protein